MTTPRTHNVRLRTIVLVVFVIPRDFLIASVLRRLVRTELNGPFRMQSTGRDQRGSERTGKSWGAAGPFRRQEAFI